VKIASAMAVQVSLPSLVGLARGDQLGSSLVSWEHPTLRADIASVATYPHASASTTAGVQLRCRLARARDKNPPRIP
jgi:hypothetical protein